MHQVLEENIRNWAYILLSIGRFLRQDKAANLPLSDISLAKNPTTDTTPHRWWPATLVVMIVRDKTNKDGSGIIIIILLSLLPKSIVL